jgi:uncharacterized membrane protein
MPVDDKLLLLVMYLVMGLLLIGLSIPLMQNRIKPNGLYGFRIPKTMNNPEIWYAVNHHYSYRLLWAGASCVLAALILYAVPNLSLDAYALSVLGVFAIVFLAGLVQSIRFMNTF